MYIQYVIEMRYENLKGDRTHQNKLLFYLPFVRKIFLNPDKILISLIVNSSTRQCLPEYIKSERR
jgi:hypothetical protein